MKPKPGVRAALSWRNTLPLEHDAAAGAELKLTFPAEAQAEVQAVVEGAGAALLELQRKYRVGFKAVER